LFEVQQNDGTARAADFLKRIRGVCSQCACGVLRGALCIFLTDLYRPWCHDELIEASCLDSWTAGAQHPWSIHIADGHSWFSRPW